MTGTPDTAEGRVALDAEARALGFPGVESYVAAYAAGYRAGDGSAAQHIEAFAQAAEASGLPLAAFVARTAPESDPEAVAGSDEHPDDEAWVPDVDPGGLRPVSETRSLSIAGDSRPAPVPTARPETTLATTAATVAVVELNDGAPAPTPTDHDFGAGTPPDDPSFGAGYPAAAGEDLGVPASEHVPEPTDHLVPGEPYAAPGLSELVDPVEPAEPDLTVAEHQEPGLVHEPIHEPVHDGGHHDEPLHEPSPDHDVPVDHGGESF